MTNKELDEELLKNEEVYRNRVSFFLEKAKGRLKKDNFVWSLYSGIIGLLTLVGILSQDFNYVIFTGCLYSIFLAQFKITETMDISHIKDLLGFLKKSEDSTKRIKDFLGKI